jgi:hypothetical protein
MTRDSFRILTKVGNSHRESEVFINWDGITEAELKILATAALKHNIQAMLKKHWEPGDESIFINAKDAVNRGEGSRFHDLAFLQKLDRTPEDLPVKPGAKKAIVATNSADALLGMLDSATLLKLLQAV